MSALFALLMIIVLLLIPIIGTEVLGLNYVFGVVIPYAAIAMFLIGFVYRIVRWASSAVPFKITTTCGQQKSHPWIKSSSLEAPHNTWGVIGRMALEVLFFRSLFRNTKADLREGPKLVYGPSKWLWAAGLVFHWSFLIILLRHFRFFAEPAPFFVSGLQALDGFFQIGLPIIYLTNVAIVAAVTFLFLRRLYDPKLRYISLGSDYFALFLILSIAASGILMRYTGFRADIVDVKQLAMGLVSFHPVVPETIGVMFYIHLFFVAVLFGYFPFSKLMHMGGIFMSPTRNMANNNREERHVNPWNYPVKTHTYEEWEDEFRDVMKAAGMPLEKEK
ncbi:MAG TPA: menaquinol oxidoreductase [candidate division Zixibacteria bacterium]|nr:menaquinol oxidoreductase [candidate division Zixibacteria bacterium]HER00042.1 menaquinol oxidoreductase [candidate division Zixibacteria bacterium]